MRAGCAAEPARTWSLRRLLSLSWDANAAARRPRGAGASAGWLGADGGIAHATSSPMMQCGLLPSMHVSKQAPHPNLNPHENPTYISLR